MRTDPDDAGLRRYLLGLLPEDEAESLEEAYLASPEVLERLRAIEDDLLDDYAAGRLGTGEKDTFEGRYLRSPVLRERVVAARALRLAASSSSLGSGGRVVRARSIRWAGPVALAAGLVLALLAEWGGQPRPPHEQSAAASPTPTAPWEAPRPQPSAPRGPVESPAPPVPPRPPTARPFVLALSPVLLRGQESPAERRIPAGTDTLLLELGGDPAVLPPTPSALEATLETVEGERIWRGEALRVGDAARPSIVASARVPAARLAPGDYLLTLSLRDVADRTLYRYFFRVSP